MQDPVSLDFEKNNTDKMLSWIGPEAVKNVNNIAKHESKILELENKMSEIEKSRLKLVADFHSLHASEQGLGRQHSSLAEARERSTRINEMNAKALKDTDNIPKYITHVLRAISWMFWNNKFFQRRKTLIYLLIPLGGTRHLSVDVFST